MAMLYKDIVDRGPSGQSFSGLQGETEACSPTQLVLCSSESRPQARFHVVP